VRNDPDPRVLDYARQGNMKLAVDTAYELSAGVKAGSEVFHFASAAVDEVFGRYHAVEIACTRPAADALVAAARMPLREAELVTDLWLDVWRKGRTLNCPREARA